MDRTELSGELWGNPSLPGMFLSFNPHTGPLLPALPCSVAAARSLPSCLPSPFRSRFVLLCSPLPTERLFGVCRELDGLKRGAVGLSKEPWH